MTLQDPNADIKRNLREMATSEQAYGNLLRAKKDLTRYLSHNPGAIVDSPIVAEAAKLLHAIPAGATCECCGYEGLVNVKRVQGHIVGPECANHPLGTCRGKVYQATNEAGDSVRVVMETSKGVKAR